MVDAAYAEKTEGTWTYCGLDNDALVDGILVSEEVLLAPVRFEPEALPPKALQKRYYEELVQQ